MKSNIVRIIGGTVLAVLIISTLTTWVSAQDNSSTGGRLEGTWDVQVTVRSCQTGVAIRTFASTTTFISGGTLIDSTSGTAQALKTPGHGVWNHLGGNRYRFSFKSFTFDAAGNFTGWQIVRHEANLSGSATETSAGTSEIYNSIGNLVFTGCSTATGTRFE